MPRKGKRVGRPPGSKNKKLKSSNTDQSIDIKQEVNSGRVYVCTMCKKSCDEDKWESHVEICRISSNIKQQYCCKECGKKFKFKKSYLQHIELNHSTLPNSVACTKCKIWCPNETVLKEHIETIHKRASYVCPECNKEFVRRSHVTRHMTQSGCNGHQLNLYPCEICNSKFTRKDNLIVHLRTQHIHKSDKYFFCKSCTFETKNFSRLVNHWLLKHSGTPNYYECYHCGKSTGSRTAMAKHLEIHGEKSYACEVCGYATYTVEVMRRHILTHVTDKPYKCEHCNRSYIKKSQLQRHLDNHDMQKMCLKCGETFSTTCQLLDHKNVHKGNSKFACHYQDCQFSKKPFLSEAQLQKHVKVHLEDRPYECEVCGKRFAVELHMRRHLSTHTLERPRRCMYCVSARAYVRGEQLVKHVRVHHPAVFGAHLKHVRAVLGIEANTVRVKKSELECILNMLDAESDRIMDGYGGTGVLYGGMQEQKDANENSDENISTQNDNGPLMTEEELLDNLGKMLFKLIDSDTLECFGWPDEPVDVVLEKVIEHCGAKPADRTMWTRMQRLRENTKHLFLYVIDDKNIARMLDTHTIDQIVKHILAQVSDTDK
ncbi:gastrula zinc finger protein XlCGF57.1-like isoform X1 [Bombyx mandarina]|uniref:Gastrula zinc finger protein XlCGF57.1-like isoform X1 n=2 Tax=Bombyx mandarina TaxID=7092 RepID=A0A6J2JWX0_BOMMA|nr:gastrula zinc finger protein XlCGF57.1-like isoform X1 [Bombyx mandarina]